VGGGGSYCVKSCLFVLNRDGAGGRGVEEVGDANKGAKLKVCPKLWGPRDQQAPHHHPTALCIQTYLSPSRTRLPYLSDNILSGSGKWPIFKLNPKDP
jgi:hypothetical protein